MLRKKTITWLAIIICIILICIYIDFCSLIDFYYWLTYYSKPLFSAEDKSSFLSFSAGVIGTFISIVVPIAFTIISNNLKDYNDIDLAKIYRKEPVYLGLILTSFLLLLISFIFFYFKINTIFTNYITLFLSLSSLIFLFLYIRLIAKYALQSEEILLRWAEKNFKSILNPKKQKGNEQQLLFRATPKVFNSFKRKIETEQIEAAEEIIDTSILRLKQFINLSTTNPKKYNQICVKKEIFDNLSEKDKSEFVSAGDYDLSAGIQNFGGLIHNFWLLSLEKNKISLADKCLNDLTYLLVEYATVSNNGLGLLTVLEIFHKIVQTSLERSNISNVENSRIAAFRWYKKIRFSRNTNSEYHDDLDYNFYRNIKAVIDHDHRVFFEFFIRDISAIDSNAEVFNPIYRDEYSSIQLPIEIKIFDTITHYSAPRTFLNYVKEISIEEEESNILFDDLRKLRNNVEKIKKRLGSVFKLNQLEEWQKELQNIIELIKKHKNFLSINDRLIEDDANKLMEYSYQYYCHNNFLLVMTGVGSYCLYKGKYEYCFYLLNYNQPLDANNWWYSQNIVIQPKSFLGVTYLLANMNKLQSKIHFMDGILYRDFYVKIYFLVLYTHIQGFKNEKDSGIKWSFNSIFTHFNIRELLNLKFLFNEFMINGILDFYIKQVELLEAIKVTPNWIEKNLKFHLFELSECVREEIDKFIRQSSVDQHLVDFFKNNAFEKFKEKTILRDLLMQNCKLVCNFSSPLNDKFPSLEVNHFGKKRFISILSESKNTDGNWAGGELADKENNFLFQSLVDYSQPSEISLSSWFKQNESSLENKILITRNILFSDLKKLSETNDKDWKYAESEEEHLKIQGRYKDVMEVYYFYSYKSQKSIIILDKRHLGKFVQYSPSISRLGSIEVFQQEGNLLGYSLDFYSENYELLQMEMDNPAADVGIYYRSNYELREFLLKNAKLRFQTKIEFRPSEMFSGIYFSISE